MIPWYKQFWPWFLITFPAASVIAGITTIVIAAHDPDDLVVADYYRAGLAINQDRAKQRQAMQLGLQAELKIEENGQLGLVLEGSGAEQIKTLKLYWVHNTLAERDHEIVLNRAADGSLFAYVEAFDRAIHGPEQQKHYGRWQVMLVPEAKTWRLVGTVQWPAKKAIALLPG